MKRPLTLIAVGLAGFGVLAACSPDSTDFQSEGQKFIEDDGGDVATQTGFTFSDADCEEPDNTDVGTMYTCTATDDEGDEWEFTIEITGKRELTVQSAYVPKLAVDTIVQSFGGEGTVDAACVQSVVDGVDPDQLREAYLSVESSDEIDAFIEDLNTQIGEQCLS